jgi:hypothetical protein
MSQKCRFVREYPHPPRLSRTSTRARLASAPPRRGRDWRGLAPRAQRAADDVREIKTLLARAELQEITDILIKHDGERATAWWMRRLGRRHWDLGHSRRLYDKHGEA